MVSLGHCPTRDVLWVGVWLGPVFIKPLVMVFLLGVVALVGMVSEVGGGCGWCSCPYFENCIVDASIFVANVLFLCCVTSY